eukprot:1181218-Prorocentrum_minimum.AAC.2
MTKNILRGRRLRQVLVFLTAVLVYTELFWNTLAWGTLTTAAIVMPGWRSPRSMYDRFHTYLGYATSPELAIYSTPLLRRFASLHKQDLEDLSLIFRCLSFLLGPVAHLPVSQLPAGVAVCSWCSRRRKLPCPRRRVVSVTTMGSRVPGEPRDHESGVVCWRSGVCRKREEEALLTSCAVVVGRCLSRRRCCELVEW